MSHDKFEVCVNQESGLCILKQTHTDTGSSRINILYMEYEFDSEGLDELIDMLTEARDILNEEES